MKNLLMSAALLAVLLVPAGAQAARCRNAKGQFATCGAPGAMTDAQYHAMKGKPMMMAAPAHPAPMMAAPHPAMMAAPKPAMAAPAPMMAAPKPAMMGPKPAMTTAPKPGMMAAPKAKCKDAKGKFIKCK